MTQVGSHRFLLGESHQFHPLSSIGSFKEFTMLMFVCRPSRRILLQERCDLEDGGVMQVE